MKGKKSKKQVGQKFADHGTDIRHERGEMVIENNIARVKRKEPLDDYRDKNLITDQQFWAGFQLQVDHAIANEHHSILSTLVKIKGSNVNVAEDKLTAKDRFNRAIKPLSRISYQVAYQICIERRYLSDEHVRTFHRWSSTNSGMDRLKEALEDLHEAYEDMRDEERRRVEAKSEEICR